MRGIEVNCKVSVAVDVDSSKPGHSMGFVVPSVRGDWLVLPLKCAVGGRKLSWELTEYSASFTRRIVSITVNVWSRKRGR